MKTGFFFVAALSACVCLTGQEPYASHMLLKNYQAALDSISNHDTKASSAKIVCLAHLGRNTEMIRELQLFAPSEYSDHFLEELAWAIIQRGISSSSPLIRFESLMACCQSQDSQAIFLIKKCLGDDNIAIRSLAYQGVLHFRDHHFYTDIFYAIEHDPSSHIRALAIQALATSYDARATSVLEDILSSATRLSEEKEAAFQALYQQHNAPSKTTILTLVNSSHATLRSLGWRLIAKHPDLLSSEDVAKEELSEEVLLEKIAALVRNPACTNDQYVPLLKSPHARVQACAAWYCIVRNNTNYLPQAIHILESMLSAPREIALQAACFIAHGGESSIELIKRHYATHEDPYVKINLSLALIRHRIDVAACAKIVQQTLSQLKEKIDTASFLHFSYIQPNKQERLPWLTQFPEIQDLLTRLHLLSILASCQESLPQEEIASFLKSNRWGVALQAAQVLLEEWPDTAKETLIQLMKHEDKAAQLQAAIILAFTHQEQEAEKILCEGYSKQPRHLKEEILLALGALSSKTTIPFLLQALDDPSEQLRIRAAYALLRCATK